MKTVKISAEVHKPRCSTTEMTPSGQNALASLLGRVVNTYPPGITKNLRGGIQGGRCFYLEFE
jgi:hypothetical protein